MRTRVIRKPGGEGLDTDPTAGIARWPLAASRRQQPFSDTGNADCADEEEFIMTLGCAIRTTVALAMACFIELPAGAQAIRIDAPTEVGRETDPRRFVEPHLAVDPNDPDHLLVAVFVSWDQEPREEMQANQRCASFASRDKGQSWSRHEFPLVDCVDPQVAILPDGQAIFVGLGRMPGIQPRTNTWLVVYHSPDGGVTWDSEPTLIGRGHDHPALVVDLRSPSRKGWVYITTTHEWRDGNGDDASGVFVVRSRDGGKSFDEPALVSPNELHNGAEMPAILSDGTLVVSFVDDSRSPPRFERRRAWIIRSENGASSFSTPFLVSNDVCGPPPVFQLSAMVADGSEGPSRDRLYFACRQSGGGPVVIVSSKDRGKTWNRPGVPAGPTTVDVMRRVMTLAVNNAGVLGVFIAERRATSGEGCLQFLFTASFDGGQSFASVESVSTSECRESTSEEIAQRRHPTNGDYFGMTSLPDGSFRVMWPQMRDGHSLLLTTTITSNRSVK
jgi:hypothetical protein